MGNQPLKSMPIQTGIAIFALVGMVDAFYTALQQRYPSLFQFCFSSSFKRVSCRKILHGPYARLFTIPNAWIGVGVYLFLAIIYGFGANNYLSLLGAVISALALIVSLYLLYVQARILKAYCIFCLISTLILITITFLALTHVR